MSSMYNDTMLNVSSTPTSSNNSQLAINRIKELVSEMEASGVKISIDEMDFGKTYQVIIKIDK